MMERGYYMKWGREGGCVMSDDGVGYYMKWGREGV